MSTKASIGFWLNTLLFVSCIQTSQPSKSKFECIEYQGLEIKYARGFSVHQSDTSVFVLIHDPNTRQVIDSLNVT